MPELDDGIAKLEKFTQVLAATRDQLQEAGGILDDQREALSQLEANFQSQGGAFREFLDQFLGNLGTSVDEAATALDDLGTAARESVQEEMAAGVAALGELEETFSASLDEARGALETDAGELKAEGFGGIAELTETLTARVADLSTQAEEAFAGLSEHIAKLREQLDAAEEETVTLFTEVLGEVEGAVTQNTEETFVNFVTKITDDVTQSCEKGIGDVSGALDSGYADLLKMVDDVGNQLIEAGEKILADMRNYVEVEAAKKIEDSVKNAIEEIIRDLIADIAESMGMMAAGAATTGAMSPYIVPLAGAKAAVSAINDLLDALNPFD